TASTMRDQCELLLCDPRRGARRDRAADLAPAARRGMRYLGFLLATVALAMTTIPGWGAEPPLVLEAKIPLGAVKGRIDHFAVDVAHQRLFVAELGNDTVGVINLKAGTVTHRLSGLDEPQGLGYFAATDTLFVANGSDG